MTRRLFLAGAASLAVAACWSSGEQDVQGFGDAQSDPSMDPQAGGLALSGRVAYMAVIAHPDDDLYFMNPGVENVLRAKMPVVTVVLSAAEGLGRNTPDPVRRPAPLDVPGYVRARQNGLRAAYAVMAGLEKDAPWTTKVIELAGMPAELSVLDGADVALVFLGIADDPWGPGNRTPLAGLWNGLTVTQPTIVAAGGAVRAPVAWSKDGLIEALVAVLDRFEPTTVWTTDPDPELRGPGVRPGVAEYGDYTDCEDHVAAARFTLAALQRREARAGGPGWYQLETFCGYSATRWPESLNPAAYREKLRILAVYGWADHHHCADHAGCGDLSVGDGSKAIGWSRRTNRRHSAAATDWLTVRDAGVPGGPAAVEAFGVIGSQCAVWVPGQIPRRFGPRGLAPAVARADTAGGGTWLAALQLDNSAEGSRNHQVVAAFRPHPSAGFGDWITLGAPDLHRAGRAQVVGSPRIAVDGRGAVHVLVRNAEGGLSLRSIRPSGTAGPWTDLGGRHVADGPSLILGADGIVEAYQAAGKGVLRWRLDRPAPAPVDIGAPESATPVTAVVLPDGRVRLFLRHPASGVVLATTQRSPGGAFDPTPLPCSGSDGYGPIAATVTADATVIAQRLNNGAIGVGHLPHADTTTTWQTGGPLFVGQPALATDNTSAYLAVIGPDSRLAIGHPTPDRQPERPCPDFTMIWA